jgi:protein prenyltransferase alpha subunit repeat containing protein 1
MNDKCVDNRDHVEIVAGDLEVVLDEHVLGIGVRTLAMLFMNVRGDLEKLLMEPLSQWNSSSLWNLTLVCLLATTENLRVINIRKKLIIGFPQCEPREELRILNILFSSPLQKHTKSPMLWQHRRWLWTRIEADPCIEDELRIIFRAAELHPRNYYAWTYARWLVQHYSFDLVWLADRVYGMCKQHVSDISVWSFLQFVLETNGDIKLTEKYVHLCFDLGTICLGHESMWMFLRWGAMVSPRLYELILDKTEEGDKIYQTKAIKWFAIYKRRGVERDQKDHLH